MCHFAALAARSAQLCAKIGRYFDRASGAAVWIHPQELIGQGVEILVPERFRLAHPARPDACNAHLSVRPMGAGLELFGWRKDGGEFPEDLMSTLMETADGRVVISVIRDIFDRKRAEEAIRRNEQQFRALFEFPPRCPGHL